MRTKKIITLLISMLILLSCSKHPSQKKYNSMVLAQYGKYSITVSELNDLLLSNEQLKKYVYMNHDNMNNFLRNYLQTKIIYDKLASKINEDKDFIKQKRSYNELAEFNFRQFVELFYLRKTIAQSVTDTELKKYYNQDRAFYEKLSAVIIALHYGNNKEYLVKNTMAKKIVEDIKNGKDPLVIYRKFNEDPKNNGYYSDIPPDNLPFLKGIDFKTGDILTINDKNYLRIVVIKKHTGFKKAKKKLKERYIESLIKEKKNKLEKKLLDNIKFISQTKFFFINRKETYQQNNPWEKKK